MVAVDGPTRYVTVSRVSMADKNLLGPQSSSVGRGGGVGLVEITFSDR